MHPHTLEQQSELTAHWTLTARQGAERHVPLLQMPEQHWDGLVQATSAGRHAHFLVPLLLTMW